jgi:tRNA threonylcarbamoyladenosine biosynthesis protein TsaB
MKLLAIDSSTAIARLAIAIDDAVHEVQLDETHRHAEIILPALETLLQTNNVALPELTGIIYAAGPGSFTGVRVTIAVVQALSLAHGTPTLGLSTLNIMAQTAYRIHQCPRVLVTLDARMGEIYFGAYEWDAQSGIMCAVQPDALCKPEDITCPNQEHWMGVGQGRRAYESHISANILTLPWDDELESAAEDMLTLGRVKIQQGLLSTALAMPFYLRNEVAHKKQK